MEAAGSRFCNFFAEVPQNEDPLQPLLRITKLERSFHNLKQYSRRECVEIAGIPRDIPHVITQDVVIKLLIKTDVDLPKK